MTNLLNISYRSPYQTFVFKTMSSILKHSN